MYPPREHVEPQPSDPRKDEFNSSLILGFVWLAWAAWDFFGHHKPKDGICRLELAVCMWLQAVLVKMGIGKKRDRLLILVGCFVVVGAIDWAAGLF
jgi:hypothetical protein